MNKQEDSREFQYLHAIATGLEQMQALAGLAQTKLQKEGPSEDVFRILEDMHELIEALERLQK